MRIPPLCPVSGETASPFPVISSGFDVKRTRTQFHIKPLSAEDDAPIRLETEPWVMRDLPRVPVEVAEDAGVAAVEGLGRFARDRGAVPARLLDHVVDLLARADVVRERDAAPARAVVWDAVVLRELLPPPEHEDDAVRLEERRLL